MRHVSGAECWKASGSTPCGVRSDGQDGAEPVGRESLRGFRQSRLNSSRGNSRQDGAGQAGDFAGGYDFNEAFRQPFRPEGKADLKRAPASRKQAVPNGGAETGNRRPSPTLRRCAGDPSAN